MSFAVAQQLAQRHSHVSQHRNRPWIIHAGGADDAQRAGGMVAHPVAGGDDGAVAQLGHLVFRPDADADLHAAAILPEIRQHFLYFRLAELLRLHRQRNFHLRYRADFRTERLGNDRLPLDADCSCRYSDLYRLSACMEKVHKRIRKRMLCSFAVVKETGHFL